MDNNRKMSGTSIFYNTGNIGIGTTTPNNIFQVGDGARLRISNGISDYSLFATKDVDDITNTRIVVSGNTRGYNPGCIEHVATGTVSHIYFTGRVNERMRIIDAGITATQNKLNFPNLLDKFKINLWGTNEYGFGIATNILQYSTLNTRAFYTQNTNTFTIDSGGNTSCIGT
jgi:hypothetical protein